ncbi:MAG: SirB2 family protein [Burkholderiales bacterium]|nr:SirB2 family protein [Burkholderiales bacterium]
MDYLVLKTIHMSAVALSVTGFFGRGIGALAGARWVRSRLARTLPHVVDSVLLLSAIALAWRLRLDPLATPWLMAKIIGLLAYIVLGMVALRPGRPWPVRATAWVLALLTFGYIVSVAITKNPAGWLGSVPG